MVNINNNGVFLFQACLLALTSAASGQFGAHCMDSLSGGDYCTMMLGCTNKSFEVDLKNLTARIPNMTPHVALPLSCPSHEDTPFDIVTTPGALNSDSECVPTKNVSATKEMLGYLNANLVDWAEVQFENNCGNPWSAMAWPKFEIICVDIDGNGECVCGISAACTSSQQSHCNIYSGVDHPAGMSCSGSGEDSRWVNVSNGRAYIAALNSFAHACPGKPFGWQWPACDNCITAGPQKPGTPSNISGHFGPACAGVCPMASGGETTANEGMTTCRDANNITSGHCDAGIKGTGKCICDYRHSGENCTLCASGWDGGQCSECDEQHFGPNCTKQCDCHSHGTCQSGLSGKGCQCTTGWAGGGCDVCAARYSPPDCVHCSDHWAGGGAAQNAQSAGQTQTLIVKTAPQVTLARNVLNSAHV